jgi:flagellar assembly factor FliW
VRFTTTRFGEIEAGADELVHFPGLPGFPEARRFVVRRHDRSSCFGWLLCADDPDLSFVVASPWHFVRDYDPSLDPRWLRALGADSADELEVLALATVTPDGVTLNLAAPILVHPGTRRGMQAILDRGDLPTRARVVAPAERG